MNCQYCRAQNEADAYRCTRCGRRLSESGPAMFPIQHGAAAPALDPIPDAPERPSQPTRGPQLVTELPRAIGPSNPAQGFLFGPIEVSKPAASQGRSGRTASHQHRQKQAAETSQGRLFDAETGAPACSPIDTASRAPRVAPIPLRMMAALFDAAIPFLAFLVFLGVLQALGAGLIMDPVLLPYLAGAAFLIQIFYRVLLCIGNRDSLGMEWCGLCLVDADGHRPEARQRFVRLAGAILSAGAVGIGLLWALADDTRMTWHDYLSSTLPVERSRNL